MRYSVEVLINAPVARVVELFVKYEAENKVAGRVETVLVQDLPREFSAKYEFHGISYVLHKHFVAEGADKTRYIVDQEFQFTGFKKLMGMLMPGVFKKESLKFSNKFKNYVESSK